MSPFGAMTPGPSDGDLTGRRPGPRSGTARPWVALAEWLTRRADRRAGRPASERTGVQISAATAVLLFFCVGLLSARTPGDRPASRAAIYSAAPARPLDAGLCLWTAPRRLRVARVSLRRFRTRIAYGSNTSATRSTGRYRYKSADALAGDVELNPGPQPATSNPGLQKLTVLSQNVRSVRNKLHTLRAHAGELQSRDVFALT